MAAAANADCTVGIGDMASSRGTGCRPAVCHSHCMVPPTVARHDCKAIAVEGHAEEHDRVGTAAEVCTGDIGLNVVVESSSPRHVLIKSRSKVACKLNACAMK